MTIATDPNSDSLDNSDDGFSKHFEEFASGHKSDPDPEEQKEDGEPEGNGPEFGHPAPAQEETPAATEERQAHETATSGNAEPDGGTPPPSGEQAPDPWADLPDDVRERILQVERERDEARHRASSDANRVAALSRKLQQLQTAPTAAATEAPAEELTEAQKALDGKIEQLRKDYGEIADPLIELIESQKKELHTVRTVLTGMTEQQQAQAIEAETQALETRHGDWREIARSPDFAGWLEVQPDNIQRLAASWDARETSVVLTLFKAERAEASGQGQQASPTQASVAEAAATGARRSQQLEGGRDVRSRPAPAASGPPEDFDTAFNYYAEKKRLASLRR